MYWVLSLISKDIKDTSLQAFVDIQRDKIHEYQWDNSLYI